MSTPLLLRPKSGICVGGLARAITYTDRVPRWIADFRDIRATLRGRPFDWRRVVSNAYGAIAGALLAPVGVRMWSVYRVEGENALRELRAWAWGLLPLAVTYRIPPSLKKSRTLKQHSAPGRSGKVNSIGKAVSPKVPPVSPEP